jgi:hypothetical protein
VNERQVKKHFLKKFLLLIKQTSISLLKSKVRQVISQQQPTMHPTMSKFDIVEEITVSTKALLPISPV